MICFRPKNPTDYDIYDYEYSSWFGECYYADDTIYLHGGSVDTPYVIDVENPSDGLHALMLTLTIDAEKCSSKD